MLLHSVWSKIRSWFVKEEIKTKAKRKYLLKRDKKDTRDFVYAAQPRRDLPSVVDLRPQMPPVYNQGQVGSCSANAICAAHEFEQMKQNLTNVFTPSRLFLYYNERVVEGQVDSDSGACLRDGMQTINQQGVCPETEWPYIEERFAEKPTDECYRDALQNVATSYHSVPQVLDQLLGCLAEGYPIICGTQIFESFESDTVAKTGIIPMPSPVEQCLGGHAVLLAGFSVAKQCFILRNSWGEKWALGGYAYIPFSYITNPKLSHDFWTVRMVK
jgi:C1A family cysteine protease